MSGPNSDAINVAIILALADEVFGRDVILLEDRLRRWRSDGWDDELEDYGPVPYEQIAPRINALVAEAAARYGLESSVYEWSAARRWVVNFYRIFDRHGRPPRKRKR